MALAMKSAVAKPAVAAPRSKVAPAGRKAMICRADGTFIGSSTNLIMVASTTATLAAARFGFAPTTRRNTTSDSLKLVPAKDLSGTLTKDPAGFTAVDVLAMGAAGHGIGIGIVLGLKGIGAL